MRWFFGFKWYTIVAFGNLWKPHGCEKSSSWVVIENAVYQSDCILFKILISQKLFEVESLLFACNKMSMDARIWSCSFSWVWPGMPGTSIVLWNNKLPISLERIVRFSQACPKVLWNKSAIRILKRICSINVCLFGC